MLRLASIRTRLDQIRLRQNIFLQGEEDSYKYLVVLPKTVSESKAPIFIVVFSSHYHQIRTLRENPTILGLFCPKISYLNNNLKKTDYLRKQTIRSFLQLYSEQIAKKKGTKRKK